MSLDILIAHSNFANCSIKHIEHPNKYFQQKWRQHNVNDRFVSGLVYLSFNLHESSEDVQSFIDAMPDVRNWDGCYNGVVCRVEDKDNRIQIYFISRPLKFIVFQANGLFDLAWWFIDWQRSTSLSHMTSSQSQMRKRLAVWTMQHAIVELRMHDKSQLSISEPIQCVDTINFYWNIRYERWTYLPCRCHIIYDCIESEYVEQCWM